MNYFKSMFIGTVICICISCCWSLPLAGVTPRIDWLTSIQALKQNTGHFLAKDNVGHKVILEWDKIRILSNAYREMMKHLRHVIVSAYVPIEMTFLRKNPDIVKSIDFFKPFAYYFEGGIESANWGLIESKMEEVLRQLAVQEQSPFFHASDIAFFVVAKDISGKSLGFIHFNVLEDYPFGTINLTRMAIIPEERRHGLGKLLVSSIFKILPPVDHIFLYTRPSNEAAVNAYLSYGFIKSRGVANDPYVQQGWLKMEYRISQSDILQRASQQLE